MIASSSCHKPCPRRIVFPGMTEPILSPGRTTWSKRSSICCLMRGGHCARSRESTLTASGESGENGRQTFFCRIQSPVEDCSCKTCQIHLRIRQQTLLGGRERTTSDHNASDDHQRWAPGRSPWCDGFSSDWCYITWRHEYSNVWQPQSGPTTQRKPHTELADFGASRAAQQKELSPDQPRALSRTSNGLPLTRTIIV